MFPLPSTEAIREMKVGESRMFAINTSRCIGFAKRLKYEIQENRVLIITTSTHEVYKAVMVTRTK